MRFTVVAIDNALQRGQEFGLSMAIGILNALRACGAGFADRPIGFYCLYLASTGGGFFHISGNRKCPTFEGAGICPQPSSGWMLLLPRPVILMA
jgi:hypothetical protein